MKITILMPVYNGESTLNETLASLTAQSKKIDELVIIDDGSDDNSIQRIKEFLDGRQKYILIRNEKQQGLAAAYNTGIRKSSGDLIVTLHQDVLLEKDSLEKLIAPFGDPKVVAATHVVSHPLSIWDKYNFWQKVFFARLAGKIFSGIDGKFDAFRRDSLEKAGMFDEKHFRTAGEDGDMVRKLEKIGRIAETDAKIVHLHRIDPNFGWQDIVRKQAQYSEAMGALLARGRIRNPIQFAKSFFREILLAGLLVPYVWALSATLIFFYSFFYTKLVFRREYKDKRILVLPFFNAGLLFVSFFYTFRGFVYGKQKI